MNKYLPINILQTMFNKRKTHLLLTYCKLLSLKNGYGQVSILDFQGLSEQIGLTPKSIKKHLLELKNLGFIKNSLNNSTQIIVTSVWGVLNNLIKEQRANSDKTVKNLNKAPLRYCVNVDKINFLEFSHQNLATFNAFLAECLIEQMVHSKSQSEKEIAVVEEIINQVVDTNKHVEELRHKLKKYKESNSKLLWMKSNGQWGKSTDRIDENLKSNKIKLDFTKRLLLAFAGKIEWSSLPTYVQFLNPITVKSNEIEQSLAINGGANREQEGTAIIQETKAGFTPVNTKLLWKELVDTTITNESGRHDTSLSWSSNLLNRSVTTVIKYRKRLATVENSNNSLLSKTTVNLNKSELPTNTESLINYYYPFKLVKSGHTLNKLSMEDMDETYKVMYNKNKETSKSRLIMTKVGIKEIFSAQRSSQIIVKKIRVKGFTKFNNGKKSSNVAISNFGDSTDCPY